VPKIITTTNTCAECQRTFHPSRADQRYCSKKCKRIVERRNKASTQPPTSKAAKPDEPRVCDLRAVRLNPSLNPLLAAWAELDDKARRIYDYAEKHLGAEATAKAALGQEKINEGYLLLDEVAELAG